MPKGKPPGKPFQKGNKLGKGRPRIPDDVKAIRKLSTVEVTRLISKFSGMTKLEIQNHLADESLPALELVVARIWLDALINGDYHRLEYLLGRSIGKVPDVHDLKSPGGVVILRPNGERVYMGVSPKEIEGEEE